MVVACISKYLRAIKLKIYSLVAFLFIVSLVSAQNSNINELKQKRQEY